jgi:hypothetical protein
VSPCENRLPSTVALHPVYVGESVVGSRNYLAAARDSSSIVGESETDLVSPPELASSALCCAASLPLEYDAFPNPAIPRHCNSLEARRRQRDRAF